MSCSTLTEEAFQALRRMKHDLYAVGAEANDFGTAYDRTQRDAAWKHIVLLVDELLRHRAQFPSSADTAERARLAAFVSENSDAFETRRLRVVTRSAAV
jgi:hypothetical protein